MKATNLMNLEAEKEHPQTAKVTSYEARMSVFMIGTIYKIMIHRVCKRYSPEGLSFLMGKELSFIGKVEQMGHPNITLTDMGRIGEATGATNLAYLFQEHGPSDLEKHTYRLTKTICKDRMLYEMVQLLKNGKTETLFVVWDENHETDYYPHSTHQEQESVRIAVQALIDLNYFYKQRPASEIFRECQSLVWEYLNPMNLYQVLTAFTKQRTYPKLKRVKSKYSAYEYITIEKSVRPH